MAATGAATGFFSKPLVKQGAVRSCINVGSEQFYALTVAMFDYLKSGHRVSETTLKIVLERFYSYNPKLISADMYRTVQQRMSMLINNNPRRSEVIHNMAYLLRQIAVDEILANPTSYRSAFEGLTPETPVNYLRQPGSALPATVFAAASANPLKIKIDLVRTEPTKELGAREVHDCRDLGKPNFDLSIQVQGGNYFPKVWEKAAFAYVSHLSPMAIELAASGMDQSATVEPMLKKIEADNQNILESYLHMRTRFIAMVKAGELAKDRLLHSYILFLAEPTKLNMNTNEFFDKLLASDKNPMNPELPYSTEEVFVRLMIDTLSGLISIGEINSDSFFNCLEEKVAPSLS